MSQFGSSDPTSEFDTTQDIPFGQEYPLSPDTSAMMDAGSYNFEPGQQQQPSEMALPPIRMGMPSFSQQDVQGLAQTPIPQTTRDLPGLASMEDLAQLQPSQSEDIFRSSDVGVDWNRGDTVVAPWDVNQQNLPLSFDRGAAQENYKAIDALWDQLSGQEAQRVAQTEQPMTPEELSPRRTMTQLIEGQRRSEAMQGLQETNVFGIPVTQIVPGFDQVMSDRNIQRSLASGRIDTPEARRYFDNLKFGDGGPGFITKAEDVLSRGMIDVAALPKALLQDIPVSFANWVTDGSVGKGALEDAARFARWRSGLQENGLKGSGATEQFFLDVLQAVPQVAAQTAAAMATGGGSLLSQGVARTAVFAGMGAGQTATNQFYDSLDAELKAGVPIEEAGSRALRDAMYGGAITFATEALVGQFGRGYEMLRPTTMKAVRSAIAESQLKTILRAGRNGFLKEATQETLDQLGGDFSVALFRQNEDEFKEFYKQNPGWAFETFKNGLYAGLVGGVLGVPTGVVEGISEKNHHRSLIGGLDKVIGALPDSDPRIRMISRESLSPEDAVKIVKWMADADAKLNRNAAEDVKQERILGSALDLDSVSDETLQRVLIGGPDAEVTARLRGTPDEDVGKYGNVNFVVTPAMATDELARRGLVKGLQAEGQRTSLAASEGAVNPAEMVVSKEFVRLTNEDGTPLDSLIASGRVEEGAGADTESVRMFVQNNPVLAARLSQMEEPFSRKLMEQLVGRPFTWNNTDFREDFKNELKNAVQQQQAAMDPARLQEGIDNSRRQARAQVIASLNGLSDVEVARVAMGVSPSKARIVSQILADARADETAPAGPMTVDEQLRRADTAEAAAAINRREAAKGAFVAPAIKQFASGEMVAAKIQRDAKARLAEIEAARKPVIDLYTNRNIQDAVIDQVIEASNDLLEKILSNSADKNVAFQDLREVESLMELLGALNPDLDSGLKEQLNRRVNESFSKGDKNLIYQWRQHEEKNLRNSGSYELVYRASVDRAKAKIADLFAKARTEAIYQADQDELNSKSDPNYQVNRRAAIDTLIREMTDETTNDIATILASDTALALELRAHIEGQLALDEIPGAKEGASLEDAMSRISGKIDLIRRTGDRVEAERIISKTSFDEQSKAKMQEIADRGAALQQDLETLRKEKASVEAQMKPLMDSAWTRTLKDGRTVRRKKRTPATQEEVKLSRQLSDLNDQIDGIQKKINDVSSELGIEQKKIPEPKNVKPTSTFADASAVARAESIANVRNQIAEVNGVNPESIDMRYDDGETNLSPRERSLVSFGNKLGVTVVIMKAPASVSTSGVYSKGVVYIDHRDVSRPSAWFSIAMHETMHHLASTNPKYFSDLYKALNSKIPTALKSVRSMYAKKLDMQAGIKAMRRASMVLLTDESEKYTDSLLWLMRNEQSDLFNAMRMHMTDEMAASLDAQDLGSMAKPDDAIIAETKKRLIQEIKKADRASITDEELQEEGVANIAEMLMDSVFVSIVDANGKVDFGELKRIAKTAKSTSLLARLASGIADAFHSIPMLKKNQALNDAQSARLRQFADNPGELSNPRTRQAAQALIAKAIINMMDAKRGKIAMAGMDANPMSEETARERIPALRQAMRIAEDVEPISAALKRTGGIDPESLRQAIRSIESLDNPLELVGESRNPAPDRQGITPIRIVTDNHGNNWIFKFSNRLGRESGLYKDTQLQNEVFTNLLAEQLGTTAFMPTWARVKTRDKSEISIGDVSTYQDLEAIGSATRFKDGVRLLAEENREAADPANKVNRYEFNQIGRNVTFENAAKSAIAILGLSIMDMHGANIDSNGTPIDFGGSVINYPDGTVRRGFIANMFRRGKLRPPVSDANVEMEIAASMSSPVRDTDGDLMHPNRIFDVNSKIEGKYSLNRSHQVIGSETAEHPQGFDYAFSMPTTMLAGVPHHSAVEMLSRYSLARIDARSINEIKDARMNLAYDMMDSMIAAAYHKVIPTSSSINYFARPQDSWNRVFRQAHRPGPSQFKSIVDSLSQVVEKFIDNSGDIEDAFDAAYGSSSTSNDEYNNSLRNGLRGAIVGRMLGIKNTLDTISHLIDGDPSQSFIDDNEIISAFVTNPPLTLRSDAREAASKQIQFPVDGISSVSDLVIPKKTVGRSMRQSHDMQSAEIRQSIKHRNNRSTVDIMQAATDEEARMLAGLNTKLEDGSRIYNAVRDIGIGLSRRTIQSGLEIAPGDNSKQAIDAVSDIIADEIKWQLGSVSATGTGVGWYSVNWPQAIKKLGKVFPELKTDRGARDVFSALVAIMSNGAKVQENMNNAIMAYAKYRTGVSLSNLKIDGRRADVMRTKLRVLESVIDKYGHKGLRRHLLSTMTVAELNQKLRALGKNSENDYLADTIVPVSAMYFGPKLGMFFANLMGGENYLTMDMWWTRSINRIRGLLEPQPTDQSIANFREMLGEDAPSTKQDLVEMANDIRQRYSDRNFKTELEVAMNRKEGTTNQDKKRFHAAAKKKLGEQTYDAMYKQHRLEKVANTIGKNAFDILEEAPFNASDRKFMMDVAKSAQAKLKKSKIKLSISDIQAALWYYEKRLYGRLRGGGEEDIGYDEAVSAWVDSNGSRSQRPSVRFDSASNRGDVGRRNGAVPAQTDRGRNAAQAGRRERLTQSIRLSDSESNYQPTDIASAEERALQAIASPEEIGDRLGRIGAAWAGTVRRMAPRMNPESIPVSVDDSDIEIIEKPADISPFWKYVAAPLNLAIGSGNSDVIGVVEDMIDMDMKRNLITASRQQEAQAMWDSIPKSERDEEEFARYMDEYHPPETIDTNPEFASKSQQWRDALKWFKNRDEARRQEIIEVKRESILGMLKREKSSRIVSKAAEYGKSWEVVRNDRGRKMIKTEDGTVTIPQARELLSREMMPDDWGRQYAHFYHWFSGEYKLAGYNADGTRQIIGSAMTEPEAYEKLYAFKKANPGLYTKYTAEPAVQINPDELVRMSDGQRRRLERMLSDATGAYRADVADAMRGIVGSRTSKRPFYAPLIERTGAKGFETDFMKVWNLSERLHNRWSMGGQMVRELTPRIESIRRDTPGWGDYLSESMRHTLYTAPTATEAALDSMIRAIPVVGKMVGPFATRRLLGSLRALNYGRQLLTVRQQLVNSFQPLQTVYPILGEKGMMEAIAFYNSEEGKEVLRKHGHFDASGRFKEGSETVLGADIVDFISTMNSKIYKATNESFNPSSESRNQNFAFVAMYWHGKQKGMTDAEAARYGRVYGNVYTQFYYTKANVPWLLRGPIGSTSLQYRRFALNTTGLLVNEFQKGNYSGVARYMAMMSIMGGIQASIGFSLASLIRSVWLGDKEGADDLTFKLRKWLKGQLGSDKAADIAMMGLPAAIGIDLSGSISIWQKPFGRNLYEKIGASVSGPTINTILQMMTNLTAETAVPMTVTERGTRAILDSSPTAQQIVSLWKLFSGDNIEYDAMGRMKYKLDPAEQFLKAGAFRTVNESVWAMEYQRLRIIRNEVDRYADKAATYLAAGDTNSAQKTLREFNSLYPMASMTFNDIKSRVKNKKMVRTTPQLDRRIDVESGIKARAIANQEEIGR